MGRPGEQLSFEGTKVYGVTFAMRSVGSLGGKEKLKIGETVVGEWTGEVTGVSFDVDKDGIVIRKHLVSVSKATIAVY